MFADKPVLGIAIRLAFSPRDKNSSSHAIFFNNTLSISEYGGRHKGSTAFPTNLKIQKKYKDRLKRVLFFTPDLSSIYEGDISGIIEDYEWNKLKHVFECIDDARRISRNLSDINGDLMSAGNKVQEICKKTQDDGGNQKSINKRENINRLREALSKFLKRNNDPRNTISDQQWDNGALLRVHSNAEPPQAETIETFIKSFDEVHERDEINRLQEALDEFLKSDDNDPQYKKIRESIERLREAISKLLKKGDVPRAASDNRPVNDGSLQKISGGEGLRCIEEGIAVWDNRNNSNLWQTVSASQLRMEVWEDIEHLQTVLKKSLREGDGSLQGISFTLMEVRRELQEERGGLKRIKSRLGEEDGFLQNIFKKISNEQEREGVVGENLSIAISNIHGAAVDIEHARKLIVKDREGDKNSLDQTNIDSIRRKMDSAAQNISNAAKEAEKTDAYPDICQRYVEADMSALTRAEYLNDTWIIIKNLKKLELEVVQRYYVYGTMYSLADKMREPAFPRTYYTDEKDSAQHKDSKNSKYKYCPSCGKYLLREDFIYCPYCGKFLA